MKLSDRLWQYKFLYEIFDIDTGNKFDKSKMTAICPTVNFIGRTAGHNGIVGYVDEISGVQPYSEGSITLALGGSIGSCFVQDAPFYTSQNVDVLKPKRFLSREAITFLTVIIKFESMSGYVAFARELNAHVKTDFKVKLPVDNEGEPDYQFMEDYIKSLDVDVSDVPDYFKNDGYDKACWYLDNIDVAKFEQEYAGVKQRASIRLSDREWKEFKVGGDDGLFECSLPNYDLKVSEVYPGEVNLITTTKDNNGCGDYVADGSCDTVAFEGNKITVNMFGYAFYQEDNFYTVGHGHVNILTPKFEMSKYSGLFVCNMINNDLYRFSFGRAVYSGVIEDLNINLPVDNVGNPDWQFMEDYIKSLPFSAKL